MRANNRQRTWQTGRTRSRAPERAVCVSGEFFMSGRRTSKICPVVQSQTTTCIIRVSEIPLRTASLEPVIEMSRISTELPPSGAKVGAKVWDKTAFRAAGWGPPSLKVLKWIIHLYGHNHAQRAPGNASTTHVHNNPSTTAMILA